MESRFRGNDGMRNPGEPVRRGDAPDRMFQGHRAGQQATSEHRWQCVARTHTTTPCGTRCRAAHTTRTTPYTGEGFRQKGPVMSSRTTALAIATLFGLSMAGTASAGTVTGNITVTSDYLFRGVTQTNEKPAIQGTLEFAADNGLYIGGFGSSISWLSDSDPEISSQAEFDVYGGYRGAFGESGFKYDVGAIYYAYPGSFPSGFNSADTTEIYGGISYSLFSAKYYYAVSDLFGIPDSDGSSALEAAANYEFVPSWTLNAVAGKQWVENLSSADYAYWRVGVTKAFDGGYTVAGAYNDEDLLGPDETWTLTVSKAF